MLAWASSYLITRFSPTPTRGVATPSFCFHTDRTIFRFIFLPLKLTAKTFRFFRLISCQIKSEYGREARVICWKMTVLPDCYLSFKNQYVSILFSYHLSHKLNTYIHLWVRFSSRKTNSSFKLCKSRKRFWVLVDP